MSTILYFLHGWGYDASFWSPMRDRLADMDHLCADGGYFGAPSAPPLPQTPFWAIGHSAGACALLGLQAPHCQGVIGINGFARFTQAEDFPDGVPARIITRMARQLARHPREVLGQFRQMCGETDPALPPILDEPALTEGLLTLQKMDHRTQLPHWQGRLYSLNGAEDPLAPARRGFGPPALNTTLPGGHRLPLTHPQDCADHIRRIITAANSTTASNVEASSTESETMAATSTVPPAP